MSLNWNLAQIENWDSVTRIPVNPAWTAEELQSVEYNHTTWSNDEDKITHYMHPVTNALIWGSILHGFSKITHDNYHEIWMRLAMDDGVDGQGRIYNMKEKKYRSITLDEVHQHIGLSTNVSPVTKTEFYNRLMKTATDKKKRLGIDLKKDEAA